MKLGLIQIPLALHRGTKIPLQRQIVMQVTGLIEHGALPPGAQLPSLRDFSREHKVAINTISLAYQILASEGWIDVRQGSPARVSQNPPAQKPKSLPAESSVQARSHDVSPPLARSFNVSKNELDVSYPVDFRLGETAAKLFPRDTWQHWAGVLIRHSPSSASGYPDPQGLLDLREAIVRHVGVSRGIPANSSDVVIVHGIQEALTIIGYLLVDNRCGVLVENPCYRGAHEVFAAFGANINYLAVDDQGVNPSEMPPGTYRLLHVTPSHQFPLGVPLAQQRRIDLLDWARKENAYILENDYDTDFRYCDSPIAAMASIDRERVIYVGTFSKDFGPGLRLGYMICPPALTPYVRKAKELLNRGCSWLDQAIVARMMQSGEFAAHLRFIRRYYKERRDHLTSVLHRFGGYVRGEGGGMHVCWKLPPWAPKARCVEAALRSLGIKVYLAEQASFCGEPQSEFEHLLFFGFGSVTNESIDRLGAALHQILGAADCIQDGTRAQIESMS